MNPTVKLQKLKFLHCPHDTGSNLKMPNVSDAMNMFTS